MSNRYASVDWGTAGLVGTLGVTVLSASGSALIVRTTSGFVDAGNGSYVITIPGWSSAWGALVLVDDGTTGASDWLELSDIPILSATFTRCTNLNWGVAGLTGTLGITVLSAAGAVLIARAATGVVDVGFGQYALSIPNWHNAWGAMVVVDDGGGNQVSRWFDSYSQLPPVGTVENGFAFGSALATTGTYGGTGGSDRNVWFVRQSGNDANGGNSPYAAFLTVAKALAVAQVGDVLVMGQGYVAPFDRFGSVGGVLIAPAVNANEV